MKVLVTGATGFVGRHVVARLLARGHEVIAVSRDEAKARKFAWFERVRFVACDIHAQAGNPVERFGGLLKAAVSNRLYLNLRKLEDHLIAAARPWSTPAAVAGLIHGWLADKVNRGAPI